MHSKTGYSWSGAKVVKRSQLLWILFLEFNAIAIGCYQNRFPRFEVSRVFSTSIRVLREYFMTFTYAKILDKLDFHQRGSFLEENQPWQAMHKSGAGRMYSNRSSETEELYNASGSWMEDRVLSSRRQRGVSQSQLLYSTYLPFIIIVSRCRNKQCEHE